MVDIALLTTAQLSRQRNALRAEFHRLHLPMRHIALEDVVRFTIEQFQVALALPG